MVAHFEGRSDFIREGATPDALTALSRTQWIPCLYHESFNISVEQTSIIIVAGAQRKKVLSPLRRMMEQ